MGYFPVRYDSRVVIYDRRGFIRLATDHVVDVKKTFIGGNLDFSKIKKLNKVCSDD